MNVIGQFKIMNQDSVLNWCKSPLKSLIARIKKSFLPLDLTLDQGDQI